MEASDTVEELLGLQEIDLEIVRINRELTVLDEELAELQARVDELEDGAAKLRAEKEEAESEVRRYQRSVTAGRATLKRLESRSAEVKNMQQHYAVRTETETARRNLREAEDDALDAMQDVETVAERLSTVEEELAEARADLEERKEQAASSRSGLEGELETNTDQKIARQQRIDRRTLRLYESVMSGTSNSALAPLTADGVCGQCYTSVPKQRQSDIRSGRDLAVCEGCGVILYASEDGD